MNIQDLILSGKLELYVAGALSETEMREIAAAAREYPELAQEIGRIENSVMQYYSDEAEPMNKEEMDLNLRKIFASASSTATGSIVPIGSVGSDKKVLSISRFAVAAMIAGILLTSALTILMFLQNQNLRSEVATIQEQQRNLLAQNDSMQRQSQILQTRFEMVRNIVSKRVELKSVPGKPPSDEFMLVYWNPKTKQVMMADANLPPLPADQQYQLWALLDNAQVDLGVFDGGMDVSAFMKNANEAKGFAVTIEPRGGSKKPTLEKLKMMANL